VAEGSLRSSGDTPDRLLAGIRELIPFVLSSTRSGRVEGYASKFAPIKVQISNSHVVDISETPSVIIKTMIRIFKTRYFVSWMRKTDLADSVLCAAVAEMVVGLIDADLGGGGVKKRVALPDAVRVVVLEHCLPPTKVIVGSSYWVSRKMIEPTLPTMS
jgi:hypothetical protein